MNSQAELSLWYLLEYSQGLDTITRGKQDKEPVSRRTSQLYLGTGCALTAQTLQLQLLGRKAQFGSLLPRDLTHAAEGFHGCSDLPWKSQQPQIGQR